MQRINFNRKTKTKSFQRLGATLLLTFILLVLLLPIILFSIPLCVTVKFLVICVAKLRRPDLQNYVSGSSVIFALDDLLKQPKLNLITLFILEGNIDLEYFRSQFQNRVIQRCSVGNSSNGKIGDLMYPQLQQYWTSYLNFLFWKRDENFDLRNHIRLYDYAGNDLQLTHHAIRSNTNTPMNYYCDEEDLRRVIGGLLAKPWPKERSPWEMLFVQNFSNSPDRQNRNRNRDRKPQTVIIFRLHHGMGDGYSYMKLMGYLTRNKPHTINMQKLMSRREQFVAGISLPFRLPYDFAVSLLDSFDGPNCWHPFSTELSRKYYCSFTRPIPTRLIKKIKTKHNVSYNDVLSTAICGALKRIMEEAGQEVPENVSCIFPFPLPNHPDGIANHMTVTFAKWPIGLKTTSDAVQRLHALSESMRKSKYFTGPLACHLLKNKLASIYPNCITRLMHQTTFCTLGVSFFPGPEEAPSFFGVKVLDIMAGVGLGLARIGATIVLFSSGGQQRFLATIDQTVFESEEIFTHFGAYVEQELDALWEWKCEENEKNFKLK